MTSKNEDLNIQADEQEKTSFEYALRTTTLKEFVGQDKLKENLKIFIEAAKNRGEALDHCLFYSPRVLVKQPFQIFWLKKWA